MTFEQESVIFHYFPTFDYGTPYKSIVQQDASPGLCLGSSDPNIVSYSHEAVGNTFEKYSDLRSTEFQQVSLIQDFESPRSNMVALKKLPDLKTMCCLLMTVQLGKN